MPRIESSSSIFQNTNTAIAVVIAKHSDSPTKSTSKRSNWVILPLLRRTPEAAACRLQFIALPLLAIALFPHRPLPDAVADDAGSLGAVIGQ